MSLFLETTCALAFLSSSLLFSVCIIVFLSLSLLLSEAHESVGKYIFHLFFVLQQTKKENSGEKVNVFVGEFAFQLSIL